MAKRVRELPWFKFYPGKWLTSRKVAAMPWAAKGLYIELLAHLWDGVPLPDNPDELARILRANPVLFRRHWPRVRPCFETDSFGNLYSKILFSLREKADHVSVVRSICAKSQGANVAIAQQTGSNCLAIAQQTVTYLRSREVEKEEREDPDPPYIPPAAETVQAGSVEKDLFPEPSGTASRAVGSKPGGVKAGKGRKKAAPTDMASFIGLYCQLWRDRYPNRVTDDPPLAPPDKYQAARLIKSHGLEGAIVLLGKFMADDLPWLVSNGHKLALIANRLMAYQAGAEAPRTQRNGQSLTHGYCPPQKFDRTYNANHELKD